MSFRKIVSAIAAAFILTGSLALGTTESFAAAPKPPAHKEISCKPGLVAHQVKVGDKLVWKCGHPHHVAKAKKAHAKAKPAAKKAHAKAKPAAKKAHAKHAKAHPKKAKKPVCKKGSEAKKVKKNGKWVWECFKVKPAAPAKK